MSQHKKLPKKQRSSYYYVQKRKRRKKQRHIDVLRKNRRTEGQPLPRPNTDIVCEITEHKGTEAGKFLKSQGRLVVDVFHANKNREVDSLGVDVALFLQNNFLFPVQVKAGSASLPIHYGKYPYIYATAVGKRTRIEDLALEYEQEIRAHAKAFFKLKSCIPRDMKVRQKAKDIWDWPSPILSALQEKSPLVAKYHEAYKHNGDSPGKNELRNLGFTGIVFLRNGFALLIRRESPDLPPPQFPGLTIPSGLSPSSEADLIVEAIRTSAREFRW